jgi:hypothetical protein
MWVGGVNVNPMEWLDRFYDWYEPVEDTTDGVGG